MKRKKQNEITVGLFGTCGGSEWRVPFMKKFEELGINYFNPQVDDWDESYIPIEADHLDKDEIILFPVTSETYGIGSLSEVGLSILQAIKLDSQRDIVIMIAQELDDELDNDSMRRESLRSRSLLSKHLSKLNLKNVYLVDTLDEMLQVSTVLYESVLSRQRISEYSARKK